MLVSRLLGSCFSRLAASLLAYYYCLQSTGNYSPFRSTDGTINPYNHMYPLRCIASHTHTSHHFFLSATCSTSQHSTAFLSLILRLYCDATLSTHWCRRYRHWSPLRVIGKSGIEIVCSCKQRVTRLIECCKSKEDSLACSSSTEQHIQQSSSTPPDR